MAIHPVSFNYFMNCVIVLPEEISEKKAVIGGARAVYMYDTHELRPGVKCRAAVLGGMRGHARILSASRNEVQMELDLDSSPPARTRAVLICALSRPQTIKKILQLASTLGVLEVHFIRSGRVEKSYLQTKALKEDEIRHEIIKGLEQAYDCIPPSVHIHDEYWKVKKRLLPSLDTDYAGSKRYVLHMAEGQGRISVRSEQTAILAIGPESGWLPAEIDDFAEHGFEVLSLGERALRVEHAAAFVLSRVEYVRAVKNDSEGIIRTNSADCMSAPVSAADPVPPESCCLCKEMEDRSEEN